mmetsp:Transcript_22153/g.46206  ORF Transcript_22153/g.46206 Transcript_22153/m.46206 type:complete len:128 (-) Transcript_22153:196-579(-)
MVEFEMVLSSRTHRDGIAPEFLWLFSLLSIGEATHEIYQKLSQKEQGDQQRFLTIANLLIIRHNTEEVLPILPTKVYLEQPPECRCLIRRINAKWACMIDRQEQHHNSAAELHKNPCRSSKMRLMHN